MDLSTRIRQARKALGLTGVEAAVRWGVNRRSLENWEQGRRLPRGIALEAIEQRIAASLADKPVAPVSSASDLPATPAARPKRQPSARSSKPRKPGPSATPSPGESAA